MPAKPQIYPRGHQTSMNPYRRHLLVLVTTIILTAALVAVPGVAQTRPTLYWGATGYDVRVLQWRLNQWGYYPGPIDGVFGADTYRAVIFFQSRNGLTPDGVVGPATWSALGFWTPPPAPAAAPASSVTQSDDITLMARVVTGEAGSEPYVGKVAVAAVILNRLRDPRFPKTIPGVIFQPGAFESVSNGIIWGPICRDCYRAVYDALNGWDPTYGAVYFWNPAANVNPWIWNRPIITQIGGHVFAR